MHEYYIASEIVRNVLDAVEKNSAKKVLSVRLEIGELAIPNVEQVTHWIQALFKGTVAEAAVIKVKTIKALLRCNSCGYKGKNIPGRKDIFQQFAPFICPRCGSPEVKIEKGQECMLRKIQAVK
jgi:hydrogenase nickel incorporation protein HypA/HybF